MQRDSPHHRGRPIGIDAVGWSSNFSLPSVLRTASAAYSASASSAVLLGLRGTSCECSTHQLPCTGSEMNSFYSLSGDRWNELTRELLATPYDVTSSTPVHVMCGGRELLVVSQQWRMGWSSAFCEVDVDSARQVPASDAALTSSSNPHSIPATEDSIWT